MKYWFFFSYSHSDSTEYLQRFYDHLSERVSALAGLNKQEISFADDKKPGYIDRERITHGKVWDTSLEDGLRNCSVFVPIYSASYFNSEYCGKELAVFRQRVHDHFKEQGQTVTDALILPVLWTPKKNVEEVLPGTINKIQFTQGSYPVEYTNEGVLSLLQLGVTEQGEYWVPYRKLLSQLAQNIVAAANAVQLQPAKTSLQPLAEVTSAFSPGVAVPSSNADEGPRHVQFIFVAASRDEIKNARRNIKFYGEKGGSDWQPYLDSYKGNASALAVEVVEAYSKDSRYEEVTITTDIEQKVKEATRQGKIVVVMVDTWTLQLRKYIDLVAPLDEYSSLRCITVVAWNEEDPELQVKKGMLDVALEGAFKTKVIRKLPDFKSTPINSYDTFKKELVDALTQIRMDYNAAKAAEAKSRWAIQEPVTTNDTFTNFQTVGL